MMLRCCLLLLSCGSTVASAAGNRMEHWLPRAGQSVELWNGDLSKSLGRTRAAVQVEEPLYTVDADYIPTLHFMMDEQRFSIPGVAATGKAEIIDERGVIRFIYRGSQAAGTLEKHALIELIRNIQGSCQLSWKLSVINRGERLRQQEGAMAYACGEDAEIRTQRREALRLSTEQDAVKR